MTAPANYSGLHRDLRRTVERYGADVAFAGGGKGDYDPKLDKFAGGELARVEGRAVRVNGDPETYSRLGLETAEPVTLLFVPNTLGHRPRKGSTAVWENAKRTVRDVDPIAPSGQTVAARVVLV